MPAFRGRFALGVLAVASVGTAVGVAPLGSLAQEPKPVPAPATAPPFQPTPLQPSLIDFVTGLPVSTTMQEMAKPKLLRRGFAGEPTDTAKGLASKIKAQEVDAPNRKKAAKYLGSVDCQQFPESQARLVELVQDPFEEVRYEAAKAFVVQYSKGWDEKPSKKEQRRKDTCRGCCDNVDILNKLTQLAYQCDAQGCYLEPSNRVREKLQEAISLCSQCSYETPASTESLTPVPDQNQKPGEAVPEIKREDATPAPTGTDPKAKPKTVPPPEKATTQLDVDGVEISDSAAPTLTLTEETVTVAEPAAEPKSELKTEVILIDESKSEPSAPLLPAEDVQLKEPAASEDNEEGDLSKKVTSRPTFETESSESPVITPTKFASDDQSSEAEEDQPVQVKAPLLDMPVEAPAELVLKKIECLRGHCPVSMQSRKLLKADDDIFVDLNGVRYCFASEAARDLFIANPSLYAPVLDGDCVVAYSNSGKRVTGNFVLEHKGRQFWFETKEARELFRAAPQKFIEQMNERSGARLASRR